MTTTVLPRILECGIVPALRVDDASSARRAALALAAGGLHTCELPMTVPGVLDVISELRRAEPDLIIGAGTVLDEATARAALLAGAQFIVSPSLNIDVIRCCKRYGIPVFPGALTPTEIVTAWEAGADIIKVFPASALGCAGYIRSLTASLPHIALMPMGGVTTESASDYLHAGACALGVGADLVPARVHNSATESAMTAKARAYLAAVAEVRRPD